MRNLHSTALAIAMLAGGGLSTTALAQGTAANDPAKANDQTQVVPKKDDLTPMKPSTGVLDDNTQRAHDRDRGVDAGSATTGGAAMDGQHQAAASDVRDWKAIDKNGDNLIEPDEMEAALKEVGPQAKAAKK